jgi:hypothetical protein
MPKAKYSNNAVSTHHLKAIRISVSETDEDIAGEERFFNYLFPVLPLMKLVYRSEIIFDSR